MPAGKSLPKATKVQRGIAAYIARKQHKKQGKKGEVAEREEVPSTFMW